ncbi:hypothetical protein CCAN12_720078 [Capnocytophaga canimorsus]|uniref:Uncharacterized protein n=1 Tax=Capnocytophaga canimorsus TaxID=28188 RepID=A0A0B7HHV1_9FLAO|nr:hypothetical protein CCAN12_720078 [Capnocytophaga canimorsus]
MLDEELTAENGKVCSKKTLPNVPFCVYLIGFGQRNTIT